MNIIPDQEMIILWKADYEGTDIQADVRKLHKLQKEIAEKIGGTLDGPYFPQDASILYVFHVKEYEWLNKAGRMYFTEAAKQKLRFVPKSYEIAVTPEEFFGK